MKFGAFLWQRRGEDLAANARLAEQLGFESVWMGKHLGFPIQFKSTYPYDESGIPPVRNDTAIHDPLIVFAYLAAVTTTIKFGTGVYILPRLRHARSASRGFLFTSSPIRRIGSSNIVYSCLQNTLNGLKSLPKSVIASIQYVRGKEEIPKASRRNAFLTHSSHLLI